MKAVVYQVEQCEGTVEHEGLFFVCLSVRLRISQTYGQETLY